MQDLRRDYTGSADSKAPVEVAEVELKVAGSRSDAPAKLATTDAAPTASATTSTPTSSLGMLQELRKNAGGVDVYGEASSIFAGFDPKSNNSDLLVPAESMSLAVASLKQLISDQRAKGAKKGEGRMWDFAGSPYAQFGKTLDDLIECFCMWARTDDGDDKAGSSSQGVGGMINVSKAFRRLMAFAKILDEHHEILTSTPLTAAQCVPLLKEWNAKATQSTEGKGCICFIDLASVEMKAFKETLKNFDVLLRVVVWLMHAAMFDPQCQKHGLSLCYNVDGLGFVEALALMPMSVVFKLQGLMIGAAPVKIRTILILDSPMWISSILKAFAMIMSAKVRKRLVAVKKAWKAPAERFGADCIPKGFAQCGGECETNILY